MGRDNRGKGRGGRGVGRVKMADREIEELKERYEAKLASERESALRLKGELGLGLG